jgi:ABC-type hemin transport system substrate-binding protein
VALADARGTLHRRCDDRAKVRIVSLVPPLTELLCDLGLAATLVGRTGYCVHPAADVELIPTLGSPANIDIDGVRALGPTHCVVDLDTNEKDTIAKLEKLVPHVIVTRAKTPRDCLGLYRLFGHVFSCEREADRLAARFDAAWNGLEQVTSRGCAPQRVLVLTGKDPWTTVARQGYVAAMLALIGWEQVDVQHALDPEAPQSLLRPAIDLRAAAFGLDRILLSSEHYPFTEQDAAVLASRATRVELVDSERLSWFGSRAIAGLDYLAALAASG